jgi:hypothetical protein
MITGTPLRGHRLRGQITRSGLEDTLPQLCRDYNLPIPLTNVKLPGGCIADGYFPDHGLIVELDSREFPQGQDQLRRQPRPRRRQPRRRAPHHPHHRRANEIQSGPRGRESSRLPSRPPRQAATPAASRSVTSSSSSAALAIGTSASATAPAVAARPCGHPHQSRAGGTASHTYEASGLERCRRPMVVEHVTVLAGMLVAMLPRREEYGIPFDER